MYAFKAMHEFIDLSSIFAPFALNACCLEFREVDENDSSFRYSEDTICCLQKTSVVMLVLRDLMY